jgi:hypothetical protein
MNYSQFSSNLNKTISGVDIAESIYTFGHIIQKSIDDLILVNNIPTSFSTLSEAKEFVNQQNLINKLHEDLTNEVYSNKSKIANIIKEVHDIKVTNNIIEQYIVLAKQKQFSIDPIVFQLREMNHFDRMIDNKIHYILEDKSIIAIDFKSQERLNNILENKSDVIEYMKKNCDNFLKILTVINKE